jgi:hypothetical protein
MKHVFLFALFTAASTAGMAQRNDSSGGDGHWNITGPAWYQTACGHQGFSPTHGIPYTKWVKPCSVAVRVCEFQKMTISYPADPDIPCEQAVKPLPEGGVQKSYLKRWD